MRQIFFTWLVFFIVRLLRAVFYANFVIMQVFLLMRNVMTLRRKLRS